MSIPVAIVGAAALFPQSSDAQRFWRNILEGRDLLDDVPEDRWKRDDYYDADPSASDKTYCTRGGFLPEVPFDPVRFGVPPSILSTTDPAQLLALIVAERTLADYRPDYAQAVDRDRVAVILGITAAQQLAGSLSSRLGRPAWRDVLLEHGVAAAEADAICDRIASRFAPWRESSLPGMLSNVVAGRVANRFDFGGTNCGVDAACGSTLAALCLAISELQNGRADLVLTGGVDPSNDVLVFVGFSRVAALSRSGRCRPFSEDADGTVMGEGLGMFALRRLEDAERDGDRIYAVLRGIGTSSDGKATSIYGPTASGQAKSLRRAYADAGFDPRTVELVEAHGTGTKAGDAAEFEALRTVFSDASDERQWCALGSVKSQIGHTKAAAGAAGLFKAMMALHHKVLPPMVQVSRPLASFAIETTPFYLNTEARPWIAGSAHPRRAGVSSFGFGGTNFHLAVEEYRGPSRRPGRTRALPCELVVVSGDSAAEVSARLAALIAGGAQLGDALLSSAARSSQRSFDAAAPARLAIVADSADDLRAKASAAAAKLERSAGAFVLPGGVVYGEGPRLGDVAALFPGQGSQYVGMGADLACAFEAARSAWDEAADVVIDGSTALHHVTFPPPVFDDAARARNEARLTQTEWAQPALSTASIALWRVLQGAGLSPSCIAGLSLGELTALCAANACDLPALVRMARRRGEIVAAAAHAAPAATAMTAVDCPLERLAPMLEELSAPAQGVEYANDNSPRQVVLGGPVAAIAHVEEQLSARGVATRRVKISTAFHTSALESTIAPFADVVAAERFVAPALPIYSNRDARLYSGDVAAVKERISAQHARTVRFREMLDAMYAAGTRIFVEVGPGRVLTRLVDDCLAERPHLAIAMDGKGMNGVRALFEGLGRLAAAGVSLRFDALWEDYEEVRTEARPAFAIGLTGALHKEAKPSRATTASAAAASKAEQRPSSRESAADSRSPGGLSPRTTPAADREPRAREAAPATFAPASPPDRGAQAYPATLLPPAAEGGRSYRDAVLEIHRRSLQAQAEFQRVMSEAHGRALRLAEQTLQQLAGTNGAAGFAGVGGPAPAAVLATAWEPELQPPSLVLPASQVAPASRAASDAVAAQQAARSAAPPASAGRDVLAALIEAVSQATGYPAGMIEPGMTLEADLGIDSIKRVEILSTLQAQLDVPAPDAARLAAAGTLAQVAELFAGSSPPTSMVVPSRSPAEHAPAASAAPPPIGAAVSDVVLAAVAAATGYPQDALALSMTLDGDLGIDSIKRVEILSEVVQRLSLPAAPAVADVRTLADVVALLEAAAPMHAGTGATGEPRAVANAPSAVVARPQAAAAKLGRFVPVNVACPSPGLATPGLFGADVVVLRDGAGIADMLAAALNRAGVRARVEDDVVPDMAAVIDLEALAPARDEDDALARSRTVFRRARTLASGFEARGGLYVVVHDTGGDFGTAPPEPNSMDGIAPALRDGAMSIWFSGVAALARTAAREWAAATVRVIDLACQSLPAEDVAARIAAELTFGGDAVEVGIAADGTRTVPSFRDESAEDCGLPIADGTVLVVTGGARGVTATTVLDLARRVRLRVALFGRTALADEPQAIAGVQGEAELRGALLDMHRARGDVPTPARIAAEAREVLAARAVRRTLLELEALGSTAMYLAVDVRDGAAVSAALAHVRSEFGPISGIIHGAGVLADKRMAEKSDEAFERVFDTKVLALRHLLDATRNDPLAVLCLFSSVAGWVGNPGQSDYAMANAVLGGIARAEARRRGSSCVVRALAFGPWDGGMVQGVVRERMRAAGLPLIPEAEGAQMTARELATGPHGPVNIVLGCPPALLNGEPRPRSAVAVVHLRTYPELDAHRIDGAVVVPFALAVEWMARLADAMVPGMRAHELRDVHARRGIVLRRFEGDGERFVVRATWAADRSTSEGAVHLEVLGEDAVVHYTATAVLAAADATTDGAALEAVDDVAPWRGGALYTEPLVRDGLFHGPAFRAMRRIDGLDARGATAQLVGLIGLGWSSPAAPDAWLTDPALVDGTIQLAFLWMRAEVGPHALPLRAGSITIARRGARPGEHRAVLRGTKLSASHGSVDVDLLDAAGEPVARLRDVRLFCRARPSVEASRAAGASDAAE